MNNSSYILHAMGLSFKEMDKPKANIVRLSTKIESGYTILQSAALDRIDSIRTKKRIGQNQIFDTDSFVPDNLKVVKRPTQSEKITLAAKTLNKAKTVKTAAT